jgi:hypothetical protein
VWATDCNANDVDVSDSFYNNWTTGSTSIATVDSYGTHTGVAVGSTNSYTNGLLMTQHGRLCSNSQRNASGGDNINPTISQSNALWYFGSGITTPPNFTLGSTSATLTANGVSSGSFQWSVTNGSSKLAFENGSTSIKKTNSNVVTIYSKLYSAAPGDVTVHLDYTPSGASQAIPVDWPLGIDSPYQLISNGQTTSAGANVCDGTPNPPAGSNGYVSNVPYKILSQFGVTVTNAPINEQFGTPSNITANNWGLPSEGSVTPPNGTFVDTLCTTSPRTGPGALQPLPLPPGSPLSGTVVQEIPQSWFVGIVTPGLGLSVQTDFANYYIDHGNHSYVVSPVTR